MNMPFNVKYNPTHADALEACALLAKPFSGFEYLDPAQARPTALLGAAIAALRPTLDLAPGIAVSAPAASSGKTLHCQIYATLAAGEPVAPMTLPVSFEEQGKTVFAALRNGTSAVLFDNLTSRFDSSTLCAATTSGRIQGRELGHSRTLDITTRALILVNGNGLSMSGDVSSRFLFIPLAASRERPQDRNAADFEIQDLKAWAKENRVALVGAVMTIVRAYIQEVRRTGLIPASVTDRRVVPGCRFPAIEVLRDAFLWCGEGDGFHGFSAALEHDGEREERRMVFDIIEAAIRSANEKDCKGAWAPTTTKQIANEIYLAGQNEAVDQMVLGGRSTGGLGQPLSPILLGRWLTKHLIGAVFDGKRLAKQKIHNQGYFAIEEAK